MREQINFEPISEKRHEQLKRVELEIVEPAMGHTWEIAYEGDDEDQCVAYNRAIDEVCSKYKLGPFFQVAPNNKPGYHAWEMLGGETDSEKLQKILPEIHKRAEEIYEEIIYNPEALPKNGD